MIEKLFYKLSKKWQSPKFKKSRMIETTFLQIIKKMAKSEI
jgi:hypothetical protein